MEDLHLKPAQYDWLLTAFYITYVSFEWMTLLYRVIPARIYISLCVLSWGLFASFQSLSTSFTSLLILRLLLGLSEAAFSPGLPFYMSFFYKREELALRTGLVIAAAPLATSFAGSLAWLITRLGQHGPVAPWRLLFLVEGFPSVCVAVFAWIFVPDSPSKAGFLDAREKQVAKLRLRRERGSHDAEHTQQGLDWREVLQTLMDPQCYLTAVSFFRSNFSPNDPRLSHAPNNISQPGNSNSIFNYSSCSSAATSPLARCRSFFRRLFASKFMILTFYDGQRRSNLYFAN